MYTCCGCCRWFRFKIKSVTTTDRMTYCLNTNQVIHCNYYFGYILFHVFQISLSGPMHGSFACRLQFPLLVSDGEFCRRALFTAVLSSIVSFIYNILVLPLYSLYAFDPLDYNHSNSIKTSIQFPFPVFTDVFTSIKCISFT